MFKSFTINKREKHLTISENDIKESWKDDVFKRNVEAGVKALLDGKCIKLYDDGRGYETDIYIKQGYINELKKIYSEKIQITNNSGSITIDMKL